MIEIMVILEHALKIMESLGPFGPLVFVPLFILATTLFFPGALLVLAAGALFGVPLGFALVSVSCVLSAGMVFLAGRHLSRGWILKKVASHKKIKALDDAVAEKGWRMVFLLRLTSVLPFPLLNYALGLSKIRFKEYILASWIGMMPGTLLYVYLGSFAGKTLFTPGEKKNTAAEWVFFALGLIVTLGVTVYATLIVKKALKTHEKTEAVS